MSVTLRGMQVICVFLLLYYTMGIMMELIDFRLESPNCSIYFQSQVDPKATSWADRNRITLYICMAVWLRLKGLDRPQSLVWFPLQDQSQYYPFHSGRIESFSILLPRKLFVSWDYILNKFIILITSCVDHYLNVVQKHSLTTSSK